MSKVEFFVQQRAENPLEVACILAAGSSDFEEFKKFRRQAYGLAGKSMRLSVAKVYVDRNIASWKEDLA